MWHHVKATYQKFKGSNCFVVRLCDFSEQQHQDAYGLTFADESADESSTHRLTSNEALIFILQLETKEGLILLLFVCSFAAAAVSVPSRPSVPPPRELTLPATDVVLPSTGDSRRCEWDHDESPGPRGDRVRRWNMAMEVTTTAGKANKEKF